MSSTALMMRVSWVENKKAVLSSSFIVFIRAMIIAAVA